MKVAENLMCPDHKDNKKYRDNFDNIFRKKKSKSLNTNKGKDMKTTDYEKQTVMNQAKIKLLDAMISKQERRIDKLDGPTNELNQKIIEAMEIVAQQNQEIQELKDQLAELITHLRKIGSYYG